MESIRNSSLFGALVAALFAVTFLTGCPDPPDKAISDAERALLSASSVSECAEKEFKEAEQMLAEAKRLVEEGDYAEAEVKAKLALGLAEKAKAAGEANWDECQKAKKPQVVEKKEDVKVLDNLTLEVVYFEYNESALSDQSKTLLRNNAEWLRRNDTSKITIEGHCDERGSTEFNLALGERRAQSVKNYLIQLGIAGARMFVLSYGEEVPVDRSRQEDGFARNRRAEFKPRN